MRKSSSAESEHPLTDGTTKKYIDMDKRVFGATPEEMKELAKQIVATGMFLNRKHLDYTSITLFQDAMASLNPVINHMVRMQNA